MKISRGGIDLFEKIIENARFLSPLKEFKLDSQPIEYRKDPLTGRWCRINVLRSSRVKQGQEEIGFSDLIEASSSNCFFCPENIEKTTPRFRQEIASEGRFSIGESKVFPNLFPFSEYHAITTITEKHFSDVHEFTRTQIENAMRAGQEFFKRVLKSDKEAGYASFNWNHLPPSGASIVHPHAQLTVDKIPTYMTRMFLDESKRYYNDTGENYWQKLIEEEKKVNERYITDTGEISWFTSFVPLGNTEVNAVFRDISSINELDDRHILDFASGLKKILDGYASFGIKSFNLTFYSARAFERRDDFCLFMKLISRPTPNKYYTSDAGFMEAMHLERIVESMPESVAEGLRKQF